MRVPSGWCSFVLLAAAAPVLAQEFADDGPLAALSLDTAYPEVRRSAPRPATQPTTQPVPQARATYFFTPGQDTPTFSIEPGTNLPSRFDTYVTSADVINPTLPLLSPFQSPAFSADARLITETSVTWQVASNLPGQVKIGAWYEMPENPSFPGGSLPYTWGRYLVLDQLLWRADPMSVDVHDDRGLGLFLIYDVANADLFPTTEHLSAGLSFKGLDPSRQDDILGLGLSYAHLTSDPAADFTKDSETSVELFYQIHLSPYVTIRPDVRYVLDPATTDSTDAVVASVRIELEY